MIRFSLAATTAAFIFAAPAAPQSFSQGISLAGLGNGGPGKSFGIAHEPTQDLIYVSVCGDFATPNNVVAVIDPATHAVIDTIACGLFPQDIAFRYDAQGNLLQGMVTDSTSGSLTVWDATRTPVATIALPDPFGWGTCYPFGLAVVGHLVYITTFDSSGDVHAVDLSTLSYSAADSLSAPGRSFGRPLAVGNELWLPATQYTTSFAGAYGGLQQLPLDGSAGDAWLAEAEDGIFVFPAGQDLERLSDGRSILGGTSFENRIYVLDSAGAPSRTIAADLTGVQGLAVDPTETLLVAVDNAAERIAFIDLGDEQTDVILPVGAWGNQPNDAVFVGGKLYVSCQGSEDVLVFDNLPQPSATMTHKGGLTVSNSTPSAGDLVQVDLTGFPGLPVYLFAANAMGTTTVQSLALELTSPARLIASGTGSLSQSFQIPARWPLSTKIQLQGVVDDGLGGAITRPATAIVQ